MPYSFSSPSPLTLHHPPLFHPSRNPFHHRIIINTNVALSNKQKGCLTSFTALTHLPAFTTDGGRGALSNNILGSVPEHPFWVLITESLMKYDWNYVFPYITISYASGQWFETAVWVCAFPLPSFFTQINSCLSSRLLLDASCLYGINMFSKLTTPLSNHLNKTKRSIES
jgi:hypothetical protein